MEALAEGAFRSRFRSGRLLTRNFRCKAGEIDLIFEVGVERVELVFVEVRARQAGSLASGIESVNSVKRRRLVAAASLFLSTYRGKARSLRFDILGWDGEVWTHVVDARME